MKTRILVLSLIIVALFASCEKDELENLQPNECAEMLYFETEEDFNAELKVVVNMSLIDLIQYENQRGYSSFGKESWELYKSIDFEAFKSKAELENFILKNDKYLEFVIDDEGEISIERKFGDRPDRYFLNENKMYQVGNNVYKIFSNGAVKTSIENVDIIREVGDDIEFYKQDERFVVEKHDILASDPSLKSSQACGTFKDDSQENGRQRLLAEIGVDNNGSSSVICYFRAKAQKRSWLGYWYNISRHFDCDVYIEFKYYDNWHGNGWKDGVLDYEIDDDVRETLYWSVEGTGENITGSGDYEPGFVNYDVFVDTDAVPEITFSCN